MVEYFLLKHASLAANPFLYSLGLFILILTQVFGAVYNILLLVVARFMDVYFFAGLTFVVSLLAEILCFWLGDGFHDYFKKHFPKVSRKIKKHTSFLVFVLARFVGVPFLSYLMGSTRALSFKKFILGSVIFFTVNTLVILLLGKVLPSVYFNVILIILVVVVVIGLVKEMFVEIERKIK